MLSVLLLHQQEFKRDSIIRKKISIMKNLRNQVQLIGHLGADPEVKTLNSGTKVARFSLATSDYYKDKEGNKIEDTQWHKIIAWNGSATFADKFLKKGMELVVSGKLVYGSYDDKEGNKRYTSEIVVSDMLILSKKED